MRLQDCRRFHPVFRLIELFFMRQHELQQLSLIKEQLKQHESGLKFFDQLIYDTFVPDSVPH
jgi:hypothetical protein